MAAECLIKEAVQGDDLDDFISRVFEDYYIETVGEMSGHEPLQFVIRVDGKVAAAVDADYFWGGVSIQRLAVAKEHRKHGLGSWLLNTVLTSGEKLGAKLACLETFDFQAPDFYVRHGFHLDMSRPGYRKQTFHYFSRSLTEADGMKPLEWERALPDGSIAKLSEEKVTPELSEYFMHTFQQHSRDTVHEVSGFKQFAFQAVLTTDPEKRVAAIEAKMFWGVVHIVHLVVEKEYRRFGLGQRLIQRVIDAATKEGCTMACVETFDFQSPLFYPKLGFKTDLVRGGWKKEAAMHYFSKSICSAEEEGRKEE